jgi:hypothetical protein
MGKSGQEGIGLKRGTETENANSGSKPDWDTDAD